MRINRTINRHWRDHAAYVYLFICICDFFIGPLVWNMLMWDACSDIVAQGKSCDASRWAPLTLQAGALFHLSFGAILGATAWKKKDELEVHNNRNDTTAK
jgi:hypothetical protein